MRFETFLIPALRALVARPRLTKLLFARDPWGNPFSDEVAADPYLVVGRMWKDGPVQYRRSYRRWFIMGYEECQLIANHPGASAGAQVDDLLTDVPPFSRLAPQTKTFFRNWMLLRDNEDHARLRKLVSRTFTPRRIADFEPRVHEAVDELLGQVAQQQSVEMMAAFNRPLPVNVISDLLGIPKDRHQWAGETVAAMSSFLDPLNTFEVESIDGAVDEFRRYILDLTAARLDQPEQDLITALAQAEDGDDRLSEDELVANVGLLVFAGHDTTSGMLGNAMIALAAHPDQRALVRENPELWPNAVEELLRYDTAVGTLSRKLTADIEVGGRAIPAGASVNLQLNAANRDSRRWDRPYELRLDRDDPRPLSFGHGLHHCVGHALARMELRVALQKFVDQFGDYTIDPDVTEWRPSVVLHGPAKVVVTRG